MSKRGNRLRLAGLIVGLAGLIEVIVWGLFNSEGEPSWYAVIPMSVYIVPFLIGLIVSWKWSLVGGITLIVIAAFWFIVITAIYFLTPSINPVLELLSFAVLLFAALGLPYLLTGILFLLSWRAKRTVQSK